MTAGCGLLPAAADTQLQVNAEATSAVPEPLIQSLMLVTKYQEMMFVMSGHYGTAAELKAFIQSELSEDASVMNGTLITTSKGGAAYCVAMRSGTTAVVATMDDTLAPGVNAENWYRTVPVPAGGIATLCQ